MVILLDSAALNTNARCCVLVGQMKNALLEIRGTGPSHESKELRSTPRLSREISSRPHHHRVQVTIARTECFAPADRNSGSAFPATLAFQIRELERETNNDIKLDAIVTVVDAENFSGYEDTSPTAKMQASYSDIILIVSAFVNDADLMTFWGLVE